MVGREHAYSIPLAIVVKDERICCFMQSLATAGALTKLAAVLSALWPISPAKRGLRQL
jgi:hypothetical protein